MKTVAARANEVGCPPNTVELRILADGTIHARNLTPAVARLLAELNPQDARFQQRAGAFPTPVRPAPAGAVPPPIPETNPT